MIEWNEWLCHTNFSFLNAASHPHELVLRAHEFGYKSLAISDFDGVYGLARSHREHQKIQTSMKLIYGCEIHLEQDHDRPIWEQKTIALYAQSHRGYQNICKIASFLHRESKNDACISLEDLLKQDLQDVLCLIPMRGLIRSAGSVKDLRGDIFARLIDAFTRERFAFVISRHLSPASDAWIPRVLELSRAMNARWIPSQDVFFHSPDRKSLHDVLVAIRCNKTLDECSEHLFCNDRRAMHSRQELEVLYRDIPGIYDAMEHSHAWAESCKFSFKELSYRYPSEMIPPHHTAMSFLHELVWQGCKKIYGQVVPDKVFKLLQHELSLVEKLSFADYFLTIWDIVSWARSQNILCQGRGSAANSAICFVLGITALNPNEFEVLFERFISVERGDPPDIDVDFEHERREEVIQYIYARYGLQRAAMVANVITFQKLGAQRAVALALGIPESLQKIARVDLGRLDEHEHQSYPWQLWNQLSKYLQGFPRHLGIHSGGFIITQSHLNEFVAYEPATMVGRYVVQWSKEDIEALGFFKIDILALGMLSAIRKCFDMIRAHEGVSYEMYQIPQGDVATYEMMQRADTVGTFQVESRAQMSMLPRLRPRCFYDLAIEVAIIRPGPITGKIIHPYLRRREGREAVTYPNDQIKEVLQRTLGIPIFQEQVMKVAMLTGGFSPGEANELRRNMAAWGIKGELGPWLQKLEHGMRLRRIPEDFIQQILGHMRAFSEYGFPESHAVSFALIAYVSCYLKCHHPAAFFSSIINSQPMGFYSPHVLLRSAQRAGVEVKPISVKSSFWDCVLEKSSDGQSWSIRMGMRLVRSLSESAVQQLIQTRETLPSSASLQDYFKNIRLDRDAWTALASADAFHEFDHVDRRSALWIAEAAPLHPVLEDDEVVPLWQQQDEFDLVLQDFRATATSLRRHPVSIIKERYWCFSPPVERVFSSQDLQKMTDGVPAAPRPGFARVFGMILIRQAPPTAKGMVFITLEDEHGFINLAFAPHIYKRFSRLIESQNFLCVEGRLQLQKNQHSILVQVVHPPIDRNASIVPFKRKDTIPRYRMYSKSIGISY